MSQISFDERVSRLHQQHSRLKVGVTYRVDQDGLMRPVPASRVRPRFPLRPLLGLVALAFGFKALLFVGLGEATYEARRALLLEGNLAEQAAAWAMQPDPAVRVLATVAAELRLP
jgi:hypothetical protein